MHQKNTCTTYTPLRLQNQPFLQIEIVRLTLYFCENRLSELFISLTRLEKFLTSNDLFRHFAVITDKF